MELGTLIAYNLKKLRKERNLTLGQLSTISGVSKGMLSDIEKGGSNPTINTLWKIANGLNVPYTRLMENIRQDITLVRGDDAIVQFGDTPHYRIYCYFPSTPARNFELFFVELDGHSANATVGHSEKAEEYIYVITGELILRTEISEYTLSQGDSLCFDASIAHTYINDRDTLVQLIVVNFYPS